MPYMSYISMMHLYESLGWFRAGAPVRKVHFAEEWNEMVRRPSKRLGLGSTGSEGAEGAEERS